MIPSATMAAASSISATAIARRRSRRGWKSTTASRRRSSTISATGEFSTRWTAPSRPTRSSTRFFARSGRPPDVDLELKSKDDVERMRRAGQIVAEVLERLKQEVKPGVTTLELDRIAEDMTRKRGAVPAFKGYRGR